MNAAEIAQATGLSYRQIDNWTTRGILTANARSPGSGRHRDWEFGEVVTAALIKRLLDVGFRLDVATGIARNR